jgi:translation elongation factor aEF-1 beta
MGKVAISIRVSLEGPEVDAEKVVVEMRKHVHIEDAKVEPLAFGLKQIRAVATADDKKGVGTDTDKMEVTIRAIKGVSDVEIESVTLVS